MARKGKAARRSASSTIGSDADESTDVSVEATSATDQAWDMTMDSSSASKTKGVKKLVTILQSGYKFDEVASMKQKIVDLAVSVLKLRKPDKALQVATCQLVSIMFITLGKDAEDAYATLFPVLKEGARDSKASAACASALAWGAVSTGGSDRDTLTALRTLAGIWLCTKGSDLDAALRAWSIVCTIVDVRTLSSTFIEPVLEHLAQYLSGSNVAVRNTAGESLALLFNQCGLQQLPDNDDELLPDSETAPGDDGDSSSMAATSSAPSLDCSSCGVSPLVRESLVTGFDGILVQMEALSKNRADKSRRSKSDRRLSRRAALASLSAMASGGTAATPQSVRCPGGRRIDLTTLAQKVVYRELAALLQSGMHVHLQHNPLLSQLLEVDLDAVEVSGGDQRLKSEDQKQWADDKQARVSSKARSKQSSHRMASHMMLDH